MVKVPPPQVPQVRVEDVLFASKCLAQQSIVGDMILKIKEASPDFLDLVAHDIAKTIQYEIDPENFDADGVIYTTEETIFRMGREIYRVISPVFGVFFSMNNHAWPHLKVSGEDVHVRALKLRGSSLVNSGEIVLMYEESLDMAGKFGEDAVFAFRSWLRETSQTQPIEIYLFFLIYTHLILTKMLEYYSQAG